MPMRELQDGTGRNWRVWDVKPSMHVAPLFDRRHRPRLRAELSEGWLVFECEETRDRRRVVPPPPRWSELPDAELLRVLDHAEAVGPRRRLIE